MDTRDRAPARPRRTPPRSDFGQPIDAFVAGRPPAQRALLEALRDLVREEAPEAAASLKWGMPCFTIGTRMMCTLGAHRAHVNLVLVGPPEAFPDPAGRLVGEGKGGRHLRLARLEDLPREEVRTWIRVAAAYARTMDAERRSDGVRSGTTSPTPRDAPSGR